MSIKGALRSWVHTAVYGKLFDHAMELPLHLEFDPTLLYAYELMCASDRVSDSRHASGRKEPRLPIRWWIGGWGWLRPCAITII